MVDPDFLARHVDRVLDDATIPELPNHYRGKVRDNYDLPDGGASSSRPTGSAPSTGPSRRSRSRARC